MNILKKNILMLRFFIIIILLIVLFFIAFYYPHKLIYLLTDDYYSQKLKMSSTILYCIPVIFVFVVGIIFMIVLCIYWKISMYIQNNNLFSTNVEKLLKKSIIILWVDLSVYSLGSLCLYFMNWPLEYNHNINLLLAGVIFSFATLIIEMIIKKEVLLNSVNEK